MRIIRIGTRASLLALRQTNLVKETLSKHFPDASFEVVAIKTKADKKENAPLSSIAGEGVFVKELEEALLSNLVDMAVHSLKDMPLDLPGGLKIAAVLKRDDARDALVCRQAKNIDGLAPGSRVGASSLRRQAQIRLHRKDLEPLEIRGNIDTRLRKLDEGKYDAIIVAACGLMRLGLNDRITQRFEMDFMLPEPGQGAIAIEARAGDSEILKISEYIDDKETFFCASAERAFLKALGGGCRVPVGAYAEIQDKTLALTGAVIALDGSVQVRDKVSGESSNPETVGTLLAEKLQEKGAGELL